MPAIFPVHPKIRFKINRIGLCIVLGLSTLALQLKSYLAFFLVVRLCGSFILELQCLTLATPRALVSFGAYVILLSRLRLLLMLKGLFHFEDFARRRKSNDHRGLRFIKFSLWWSFRFLLLDCAISNYGNDYNIVKFALIEHFRKRTSP